MFWRGNDSAKAETSTVIFCFKLWRKVDYNQMLNTIETYTSGLEPWNAIRKEELEEHLD